MADNLRADLIKRQKAKAFLKRCREDFVFFAEKCLKIKDEQGNIVPFVLNVAQKRFYIKYQEAKKKGDVRFIILKPRQLGFSTLIQAILFHELLFSRNQKALTMGHKIDASNNLFEIYNRYLKHLPLEPKPVLRRSNEKKISYDIIGSENKVDTAQSGEVGRSDTFQYLHLTEVAFYPDPKTTLLGLFQGSKYAKAIFLETTANGFNFFRNMWVDAVNGDSEFIPFFVSWLEFPPYSRPFDTIEQKEDFRKSIGISPFYNDFEGEERSLIEDHGATLEQLNWRRWAIDNLCNRDVKQFWQEYPTTWQEAFVASGRPVFNTTICSANFAKAEKLEKEGKKPIRQGNLNYVYDANGKPVNVVWEDNPKGYIKQLEAIKVHETEHYVFAAGGDVAEGLEQGDFSDIPILDRRTMKVCLVWHGHTDPDILAEEAHKIQLFLKGEIYFNFEMNNHGLTTITSAYKLGVNQYYRQDFSKGFVEDKMDLGTKTTPQTKPMMVNDLNEYIREALFEDNEKEFWGECLTFVRNAKGQMQAQNKDTDPGVKCFDDRVMARALMIRCHKWMPAYYRDSVDNRPQWLRDMLTQGRKSTTSFDEA
jgi:hypothetical protein